MAAQPWLVRTQQELRANGFRPLCERTHTASVLLTAQELKIAHLAASGMTNRQIASGCTCRTGPWARTCTAFPKLGVSSRAGLRGRAVRRPAPGRPAQPNAPAYALSAGCPPRCA